MHEEIRKEQLVAREGVLNQILDEYDFPTNNHQTIIEILYEETINEMKELGLTPID